MLMLMAQDEVQTLRFFLSLKTCPQDVDKCQVLLIGSMRVDEGRECRPLLAIKMPLKARNVYMYRKGEGGEERTMLS